MTRYILILLAATLALTSLANAQIYKSVDANGVVTFSDTPPQGSQATVQQIPSPMRINSMQAVRIRPIEENDNEKSDVEKNLSIVSPVDNATIPIGAGIFDVLLNASSELSDGESVELYLDDERVGDAQTDLEWTLTYVVRGAHRIQAKWLAEDGTTLAMSEPITVFVLRPSVL